MESNCILNFYDLKLNFFSKNQNFVELLSKASCSYKGFNKKVALLDNDKKKRNCINEYEIDIVEDIEKAKFGGYDSRGTYKIQNLIDGLNILYKETSNFNFDSATEGLLEEDNKAVSNKFKVIFNGRIEELFEKYPNNPKINFAHLLIWSILSLILIKMNVFIMHSSAFCEGKNNGILVIGRENSGKTTILRHFITLGCKFISDDLTIVRKRKTPEVLYTPSKIGDFKDIKKKDVAKISKIFFSEVHKEKETEYYEIKSFEGLKKFISLPPRFISTKSEMANFFNFSVEVAEKCRFYNIISGKNLKNLNEIIHV